MLKVFRTGRAGLLLAVLVLGCAQEPLAVYGPPSDTLRILVGQRLEITLQNVGPGTYASPPEVTSAGSRPVLRFMDEASVCPCPPAGETQRFRFEGVRAGAATVKFEQTYFHRVHTATVKVYER
jgi:hypothetical protein